MADLSRKERIPTKNVMNTRGNTREITQPTRIDHTCARSMNTKVRYKIQSQQRTIQEVTGLLREEVLKFFSARRS